MRIALTLTWFCLAAQAMAASPQYATPSLVAKPVAAPANSGGTSPYFPTQISQAYGFDTLQGGLGLSATANNGAGQTIAIIDAYHYNNALSTLNWFSAAAYSGLWNLPQMTSATFTQFNQDGGTTVTAGTDSGWSNETALDIEYAHAIAPAAKIVLYEANSSSGDDLFAAIDAARRNPAVSVISMSWGGDEFAGETDVDSYYFTTPGTKATNVTFVASTGDAGPPGLYPAFSSRVVAVGGTSLSLNGSNGYSGETAWSWNPAYPAGAGGGTSSQQSRPSYQDGVLSKTGSARGIPDVSMVADPDTGVYVYDSANGGWFEVGGTSLAAPCFAALVADANEIRVGAGHSTLDGFTQTLPALYSLSDSGDFRDITSGNISPDGDPLYSAGPGYDLATGIGSPIADKLVPDLANYGVTTVPEPSAAALLGAAALALAAIRRRRAAT